MHHRFVVLINLFFMLAASDLSALTIEDISLECAKRSGNLTALKKYAGEIEGESLEVTAKFTRLENSGLSGHSAYFMVGETWRLVTRLPTEKQLEWRIGEQYTFTARVGKALWSKGLDINNDRGVACSGDIRVKITDWP